MGNGCCASNEANPDDSKNRPSKKRSKTRNYPRKRPKKVPVDEGSTTIEETVETQNEEEQEELLKNDDARDDDLDDFRTMDENELNNTSNTNPPEDPTRDPTPDPVPEVSEEPQPEPEPPQNDPQDDTQPEPEPPQDIDNPETNPQNNVVESNPENNSRDISRDNSKDEDSFEEPIPNGDEVEELDVEQGWIEAINENKTDSIPLLLAENPELLKLQFPEGDYAIHVCARKGYRYLVDVLLKNGCDPNMQNSQNGNTALHIAVETDNLKLAVLLLKHSKGEIANIPNNNGEIPGELARKLAKNNEIIELLNPPESRRQSMSQQNDTVITETLNKENEEKTDSIEEENESKITDDKKPSVIDSLLSPEEETKEPEKSQEKNNSKQQPKTIPIKNENNRNDRRSKFAMRKIKSQESKKILDGLDDMETKKKELINKEGWLRKPGTIGYNKRYVIIKGSFLLWDPKEKKLDNVDDPKARKKFKRCIPFSAIDSITEVETKNNTKFEIFISRDPKTNKSNKFLFKAEDKNERDEWVKVFKQHIQYVKTYVKYLDE